MKFAAYDHRLVRVDTVEAKSYGAAEKAILKQGLKCVTHPLSERSLRYYATLLERCNQANPPPQKLFS